METMPKNNKEVFSSEEKAEILAQANEGASSMEEMISNVNRITEERFNSKKNAAEEQRIAELKAELQTAAPVDHDAAKATEEQYASVDRRFSEAQELVKKELPWYKRMLRQDASYQQTGNEVHTKAGNTVEIVTGPDKKEYVRLTEHRGGGGDKGHQSTKYYYIPLEKAQAFIEQ
jgi:hypothetical protein